MQKNRIAFIALALITATCCAPGIGPHPLHRSPAMGPYHLRRLNLHGQFEKVTHAKLSAAKKQAEHQRIIKELYQLWAEIINPAENLEAVEESIAQQARILALKPIEIKISNAITRQRFTK